MTQELAPLENELLRLIEEQQRAEEYDWFDIRPGGRKRPKTPEIQPGGNGDSLEATADAEGQAEAESEPESEPEPVQKDFFEFAGPLFSVRISPSSSVVPVGAARNLRAFAREIVTSKAPAEPGLTRLRFAVWQGDIECTAEALITIADSLLLEDPTKEASRQRIPS